MRQRLAQAETDVIPRSMSEAFATGTRLICAIAVGYLRHRFNFVGIQFIQAIDVAQDGIQIVQHADPLVGGQFQTGQIGHIVDVFFGDLHRDFTTNSIQRTGVAEYRLTAAR